MRGLIDGFIVVEWDEGSTDLLDVVFDVGTGGFTLSDEVKDIVSQHKEMDGFIVYGSFGADYPSLRPPELILDDSFSISEENCKKVASTFFGDNGDFFTYLDIDGSDLLRYDRSMYYRLAEQELAKELNNDNCTVVVDDMELSFSIVNDEVLIKVVPSDYKITINT